MTSENVQSFFVYGTLRPDLLNTPAEASWTKPFVTGTLHTKAILPNAQLFLEEWPVIKLLNGNEKCKGVVGFIITVNDPQEFQVKLKFGDEIEEYPDLYDRTIVEAIPLSSSTQSSVPGVRCYVYIPKKGLSPKAVEISSGDYAEYILGKKKDNL